MDTPRPRSLGDAATPDATREVLPPSSPPSTLEEDARARLEAEMVAVSEKVSKQRKILPANLKWDGKPDALRPFISLFTEWVEIRLGEDAAKVLAGTKKDEHGDWCMAPSV